ncbi:MAG TPA: TIGR03621 family F420-dependent LLM class oxidoreductase [Actinomycetota bacterium]|nr:TIGR03621 family F420-dependent LLM class oxidoreductase [Actinomycetota bacterium]
MDVPRFRFGIQLARASSGEELSHVAQRAEALGYDVVCLPDHVGRQLSPFPALAAVGAATTTIGLGTFVLDNDFRHPLLMAQEAATVHLLSGGRVELGLGAGWLGRDYESLGVTFDPPRLRFERLQEALDVVDLYFRGEPFSYSGRYYEVHEAEPIELPPGMSRPRLLIGAGGPRMLRLAGRRADTASVFLTSRRDGGGFEMDELTPEAFGAKVEIVRGAAGGRPVELNVLLQSFEISGDRRAAAEAHARDLETTVDNYLQIPFGLVGTVEQVAEDLLRRRAEHGVSYVTVRVEHLETFAPVVDRLAGS